MSWFKKMLGMEMTLDNLDNVLELQLRDLYSAEQQLVSALPKMVDAASSPALKSALRNHLEETKRQKNRLEQVFRSLGKEVESETCDAMQGLISEGEEVASLEGDLEAKDAALIAAAQRVEHYEIAGYGCARAFARQLGHSQAAELLRQSLEEERAADQKLTEVAESFVNEAAARS
jgi:ferritin-like metal-binding protein YciE